MLRNQGGRVFHSCRKRGRATRLVAGQTRHAVQVDLPAEKGEEDYAHMDREKTTTEGGERSSERLTIKKGQDRTS